MGKPTLTATEAQEIRLLRATMRLPARELTVMFGVSESTIFKVIHGWTFKNAGGPLEGVDNRRGHRNPDAKHGSVALWQRGCRCDPCREGNAARCAKWRRDTGHNGH